MTDKAMRTRFAELVSEMAPRVSRVDEIKPLSRARAHTLSSMRHELRAPLHRIRCSAELLATEAYGKLCDEQRTFTRHALDACLELNALLDASLELIELETLGGFAARESVSLRAMVRDALHQAGVLDPNAGAHLPSTHVLVDRASFERAVSSVIIAMRGPERTAVDVTADLDESHATVTFIRTDAGTTAADFTVTEFAAREPSKQLVWLRLAEALLALNEAGLWLSDNLHCTRVRVALSGS